MGSNPLDRGVVRQYLLGRLDAQEQLENEVSEAIFFDDDQAAMVETVEDELIEEYLDGALNAGDRTAVEGYFLRPAERQNQLRFTKSLRAYLATRGGVSLDPKPSGLSQDLPLPLDRGGVASIPYWRSHLRTYMEAAALLVLGAASLVYISNVRRQHAVLEAQLAQEKEHSSTIAQATLSTRLPMASLTLVEDISRSTASLAKIETTSSTKRIFVEIALPPGTPAAPYDVKLEPASAAASIWSARLLPLMSPSNDARLIFDVPAGILKSGRYTFVVSSAPPQPAWSRSYGFGVSVSQ